MVNCCAYQCQSRSEKKEPGISFHSFPKDYERCKIWVNNMKLKDWSPTKNDRICSKHFEGHWFYKSNMQLRVRLLNEAVPTIFPTLPKYLQPIKAIRRLQQKKGSSIPLVSQPETSRIVKKEEQRLPTPLISVPDTPREQELKRKLIKEVRKNRVHQKTIRQLKQSLRRYKKKVLSLKQVLQNLQKKCMLDSEKAMLIENMNDVNREILKRKFKQSGKYSPELRKFAITLNFFSPKAYDYVRNVFYTGLPHSSTIGKWLQSIDASPGFSTEAFETLNRIVKFDNKPCICSLVMDEMSIRQHLDWDGKKFVGYVNFGVDFEDDSNELAREAFVLMVVAINGSWKLPVAYFLSNGLNGEQKHSIIKQCLTLLQNTGVLIVSLTCDGAPSNIAMGNLLGCSFKKTNFQTNFSLGPQKYYFFLDPSHMVKLVRNTFGEKQIFVDKDGNLIRWNFIKELQKLQENEGLHLGNKLRKAHVEFFNQKMKVRLAVQLFSKSVADSIEYCEDILKLEQFRDSRGTVLFLRMLNDIFDFLNSRSLVAPGLKKAMCDKNLKKNIEFVHSAHNYISKLKYLNGELLIDSQRKMGFIGILTSLKSALDMYVDVVVERNLLIYVPIYKVSQDHIELFFSSIRSKGGWNNNPTARQFMGAYKRLMVRGEVRDGGMGNCIPLDQIPVLVVSSRNNFSTPEEAINSTSSTICEEYPTVEEDLLSIMNDHDYALSDSSYYSSQVVTYIAGFIVHYLKKKINCEICVNALIGDAKNYLDSLIHIKTYGGLTYPSNDVVKICKKSEYFLKIYKSEWNKKNIILLLSNRIIEDSLNTNLFQSLQNHVLDNPVNHIYFLIKCICQKYLNIRLHFIAKSKTNNKSNIRNKYTKLILFSGQ